MSCSSLLSVVTSLLMLIAWDIRNSADNVLIAVSVNRKTRYLALLMFAREYALVIKVCQTSLWNPASKASWLWNGKCTREPPNEPILQNLLSLSIAQAHMYSPAYTLVFSFATGGWKFWARHWPPFDEIPTILHASSVELCTQLVTVTTGQQSCGLWCKDSPSSLSNTQKCRNHKSWCCFRTSQFKICMFRQSCHLWTPTMLHGCSRCFRPAHHRRVVDYRHSICWHACLSVSVVTNAQWIHERGSKYLKCKNNGRVAFW